MQSSSRRLFLAGVLSLFGLLLLVRLGHYALWDDEAMTALAAKGVLQTGDTSVLLDHGNIYAYRGGLLIRDFCERSRPPLDTYLTAGSFLLFGLNAWTARLPFALIGLATLALILFWARRANWSFLLIFCLGLIGNVSLILFFRQCRYYSPAIFFSTAIVCLYWQGRPSPRNLLALAGLSILLFFSHYLDYLALYACLTVDYLWWKRKEWPFSWRMVLLLFGPQVLINGLIAAIWNPLRTPFGAYPSINHFRDHLTLFLWSWRDLNQCEFMALPLIFLALVIGLTRQRAWLVRGCLAILVYLTVISLISPQPVRLAIEADVRYLAPIIPLALALEAGALCVLFERRAILAVVAALLVFETNLLKGGPLLNTGFRSTLLSYVGELLHPPPEPFTPTAQWINDHVPAGASIWVVPDYATYPLMFHAPQALYAWQLTWPPRPDFASLPLIHFKGQQPPDYLIAFGPGLDDLAQAKPDLDRLGATYQPVATIPVFWKDLYRPELFWHTFQPITNYDPNTRAVYIFQRIQPPSLRR